MITIMKKNLNQEVDELDMLLLGSKRTHSSRQESNEVYNFDRHQLPPRSITRNVPAALTADGKLAKTLKSKKKIEQEAKSGRLSRDCKATVNFKFKLVDDTSTETE